MNGTMVDSKSYDFMQCGGKLKKTNGNIFHHPFLFDSDGIWVGIAVYNVYIDVTTDVGMDVGNDCRE